MSAYKKGDTVVVAHKGFGYFVSGGGGSYYDIGDELLVTSTRSAGYLNVRPAPPADGLVFKIPTESVRRVARMIGEVPEGGIAAEDPRIAWIFEDAGRMADRLGLCGDFDRLCDAVGLPGRVRTFAIPIMSSDGIAVTAKVEARSRRLAEIRVREQVMPSAQRPLILEASRADA